MSGIWKMNNIKCAHCGHLAVHQNRVEIFCREQDAETGTKVTVDQVCGKPSDRPGPRWGETSVPLVTTISNDPLIGNPSPRRHGLTVHLWCESNVCPPTLVHIYQHKGLTIIDIEKGTEED